MSIASDCQASPLARPLALMIRNDPGVIMSCHMLGVAVGAYMGGAIFESTRSYYLMFLIQGLLEFLAVIFALAIKQKSTPLSS